MSPLAADRLSVRIGAVQVCRELDLSFGAGQCWAVLGRNGVGKTTLLLTLAGLRHPQSGAIRLAGQDLAGLPRRAIARRLGFMPQDNADPFPATVMETALAGRHPHLSPWAWEGPEDRAAARAALAQVGLAGCEDRMVQTLSGGERRRLALATLLAQDPGILLLDEPASHLDLHHQVELLGHLAALARERNRLVVMVLHDLNLAARFCDHCLLLAGDAEVVSGTTAEVMRPERLTRAYGHPLVRIECDGRRAWLPE